MGFKTNSYAVLWEVEPKSDVNTKGRISISRKNKQTGEYDTDFSGFVNFLGTAAAKKAAGLKPKDRIKLGDVDVNTRYVKEKNTTYYNFNIFSFETSDEFGNSNNNNFSTEPQPKVDDGDYTESRLPF